MNVAATLPQSRNFSARLPREAAVGHQGDRIGHAAIDLDVGYQAFALGDRIVNAEFAQAQHRQANAQDLPGAEVTVRLGGEIEIFGERLHGASIR